MKTLVQNFENLRHRCNANEGKIADLYYKKPIKAIFTNSYPQKIIANIQYNVHFTVISFGITFLWTRGHVQITSAREGRSSDFHSSSRTRHR